MGAQMFFGRYLRRELRRRMRQAVVIALGLALGVGLVITVVAASSGVKNAQASVLRSLYGVGTDATVTEKPPPPSPAGRTTFQMGPGGAKVCTGGKCTTGGQTIDNLTSPAYGPMSYSSVATVAGMHGVAAAAGGLSLTDTQITIPAGFGSGPGQMPSPKSFGVDGVDLGHSGLGPLSDGKISSGRGFSRSDAKSDVAVVDSGYATA